MQHSKSVREQGPERVTPQPRSGASAIEHAEMAVEQLEIAWSRIARSVGVLRHERAAGWTASDPRCHPRGRRGQDGGP
jgi:hypothetical protein